MKLAEINRISAHPDIRFTWTTCQDADHRIASYLAYLWQYSKSPRIESVLLHDKSDREKSYEVIVKETTHGVINYFLLGNLSGFIACSNNKTIRRPLVSNPLGCRNEISFVKKVYLELFSKLAEKNWLIKGIPLVIARLGIANFNEAQFTETVTEFSKSLHLC